MSILDDAKDVLDTVKDKTTIVKPAPRDRYAREIQKASQTYHVDQALIRGIIEVESGFNPNAGSGAGARGLMQLMPATAKSLGVTNILDPEQNIMGGTKYFRQMLDIFDGNVTLALAAYNAGPGAVQKAGNHVPRFPETIAYVKKVPAAARRYGWDGTLENAIIDPDNKSTLEQVAGAAAETVDDVGTGISAIAGAFEDVVNAAFNPSTYLRFGKGFLGILALILGAWALFSAYRSSGGSTPSIPTGPKAPVPAT